MHKRLEVIETRLGASEDQSGIVFTPLKGESEEEMDARIARWYAGEKVEGQERVCTGREQVGQVKFVSTSL